MLDKLLTEQPNPASENIDTLPVAQILRIMNAEDARVAPAVAAEIPNIARAVDAIVEALRTGGRLYYLGAGTSGRLGVLDASECPPTFNVAPDLVQGVIAGGEQAVSKATEASEDAPDDAIPQLVARRFNARDVLCGIAASGRTPYVLGAVRWAKAEGAATIGISCTPASELSAAVDFPIEPVVGPEIIAGSTRLKAGTATKLVLNMISTAAMIRLGYVFGNLMVNVQPRNLKLLDRARRIVAAACGLDPERAAALLDAAGRDVRTAIVMNRLGVTREDASRRLAAAGGLVSKALEAKHG